MQHGHAEIPLASNVTGNWVGDETMDKTYWFRHMVGTVRFKDCVDKLMRWKPTVVVEVGPGGSLCTLVNKCITSHDATVNTIQSMRHPKDESSDDCEILASVLASLWRLGVSLNWSATDGPGGRRIPLPGYSFDPISCWVRPNASIYVDGSEVPSENTGGLEDSNEYAADVSAEATEPRLVRYRENSWVDARCRLYCIPFAGGSSQVFSSWAIAASAGLDVIAVELDGRGSLMDEMIPRNDVEDQRQLEQILRAIEADVAGLPFLLCGFSMGALIAAELTLMFSTRRSRPVGLVLTGRVPPTFKPEGAAPPVETYILANETVQASEGWQSVFLPMLLADLAMDSRLALRVERAMAPGARSFNLRLEVHCALNDPSFPFQRVVLGVFPRPFHRH